MTQNNLGRAFSQRINGERAKTLERAIHYFLVALKAEMVNFDAKLYISKYSKTK